MPKVRDLYQKTSTWGDINAKLITYYKVPSGHKFALCRKGHENGERKFLRSDVEVRRKAFRRDDHRRDPAENVNVGEICLAIKKMLAPGSSREVVALKPGGKRVKSNTSLASWRKLPGLITQEDRDAAEMHRGIVEGLRRLMIANLADLEEAIEDPDPDVIEAVMLALVERYGKNSVRAVAVSLGICKT